jgi:hypothetical protein
VQQRLLWLAGMLALAHMKVQAQTRQQQQLLGVVDWKEGPLKLDFHML